LIDFDVKSFTRTDPIIIQKAGSSIWNESRRRVTRRVYVLRFKCKCRWNALPRTHFHVLYPRRW